MRGEAGAPEPSKGASVRCVVFGRSAAWAVAFAAATSACVTALASNDEQRPLSRGDATVEGRRVLATDVSGVLRPGGFDLEISRREPDFGAPRDSLGFLLWISLRTPLRLGEPLEVGGPDFPGGFARVSRQAPNGAWNSAAGTLVRGSTIRLDSLDPTRRVLFGRFEARAVNREVCAQPLPPGCRALGDTLRLTEGRFRAAYVTPLVGPR
ncbi:MAG: hypothetical protein NW201_03660 [Gemmatimonadales bacterium]|nr:hypothetical protein [Gemmatimonadales bacterium]